MKPYLSFIFLSLSFLAIVGMALAGNIPYWAWFIPVGVGIIATMTIFRGAYMPQNAVTHGLELIKSQDYNNRLVKVGEPNSDRIIILFNSLIDKLRAERLQNREQESLLKLLIEASPMGVVMLDFNGQITLANNSFLRIFGLRNLSDIEGKKIQELKNDLLPEIIKVPLGSSQTIRKGDSRIYRIYHLNFIQEGFKREFYLLESLADEIMKAEKAAYEKVIRIISHEVNNTLGGLKAVLELIDETTEDPDVRKVLESCSLRCESMGNFIREYAEVVKLPEPFMKTIDLAKEIKTLLPFFRQMVREKIKIKFETIGESFLIKGDSGLLGQALINIVKNAAQSIRIEGYIEIRVSEGKNNIELIVSNNGCRIDDTTASQLFTPFFTTKPEGKGIGLTLVREVLTRHSAEFSLATESDGITRFKIFFNK